MTLLKGLGTGLCVTVLCLLVAPKAKADEWNQKTRITFSAPVEVPGVGQHILPAGTYIFKLVDSDADRHIVRIYNEDETQVLTTILAIPNYRLQATDKTVMTFRERPAGEPQALKAWFYPGRDWGDHFVYEKSRAIQLAKETNETVLSTPVALDGAPVEALKSAPIEAVTPSGDTVDTATVVGAPPAQVVAAAPAPVLVASLPKTASSLPLIGLVGLLALAGGIVLTSISKRKA
jgi:LPXTG-motif cell wall-anchored protein